MSSKVHSAQRVLMNLNCFSKCLMISAITLTRSVASFSTEREGRWGKKTQRLGGKEVKPYFICLSLHRMFFISFISSKQNGQKLITLKTALKFSNRRKHRSIQEHHLLFFPPSTIYFSAKIKLTLELLTEDTTDPRMNKPISFLLSFKFHNNSKLCNSPIVFFIHQMIPGSEGNQVRVICWCRDGNRTSTAYVRMTQLVGKNLQFI